MMNKPILIIILLFGFYFAKAQADTIHQRIKEIDSIVSLTDTLATNIVSDAHGSSTLLGAYTAKFFHGNNRSGMNKMLIDFEQKKATVYASGDKIMKLCIDETEYFHTGDRYFTRIGNEVNSESLRKELKEYNNILKMALVIAIPKK